MSRHELTKMSDMQLIQLYEECMLFLRWIPNTTDEWQSVRNNNPDLAIDYRDIGRNAKNIAGLVLNILCERTDDRPCGVIDISDFHEVSAEELTSARESQS